MLITRDDDSGQVILGSDDHSLEFRLDQQIKHYMFDEFQDTSDTQMQVFEPLLKEFFSQMYDELRSFFCVGDVKQSIYQWRNGNPELFEYVKNIMPGKDVSVKDVSGKDVFVKDVLGYDPSDSKEISYRSAQAVMDTVNAVFCSYDGSFDVVRKAFAKMDFRPHVSEKSDKPGFCALINVAQASSRSAENIPAKSRIIASILEKTAFLRRGLTVALLVPTNKVGKEYADILKSEYGLPVSIDGTVSPVDSMAFSLFKEVLTAAYHPGDKAAEKFLEMFCFSSIGDECEAPGPQALAVRLGLPADVPLAESVRNDVFVNGLGGFARRFLDAFGKECSKFDRNRLAILFDAASAFSGTPDEFLRQAEKLGQGGKSLDSTIQIMTGHKSKGLEFDVVFMPDTTSHRHNGQNYLPESQIISYDNKICDVRDPQWVSYMPHKHLISTVPALSRHMEQKENNRVFEKCCTLYVEMTRARSALFILTSRNKTDGTFSPDKVLLEQLPAYGVQRSDLELKSLLSDPEIAGYSPALLYSHGDWHWYIKAAPELKKEGKKSAESTLTLPCVRLTKRRERVASGEKSVEFVTDPEKRFSSLNGKSIGTQVHELFEKIAFIPENFDAGEFAARFEVSPIAAEIFCRALVKDSPIRAALSETDGRAKEVWCERRFLLRNQHDEIIPGAFDRVVIYKENGIPTEAEIFDYKSDNMQSAEEFAVYFPQLKLYRESLAQMLALPPEKIACRILALKIKEVVTVD
jgi:ATP-dependent helicase/nuclease subunit A